jgi:hypothetical protein
MGDEGVFVIYVNLHPSGCNIYPSRDHIPARILTESVADLSDYTSRCCAFFAAVFRVFRERLALIMNGCPEDYLEASLRWKLLMLGPNTNHRNGFFMDVEKEFGDVRILILVQLGCTNNLLSDTARHQGQQFEEQPRVSASSKVRSARNCKFRAKYTAHHPIGSNFSSQ